MPSTCLRAASTNGHSLSLGHCSPPPLQSEEKQAAGTQTEKGTGFVHRQQQPILPLRTDAQLQAVLCHQAEKQQRVQAYLYMLDIKVICLLPGTPEHLLDVRQRVALGEVIGMALPEHVSHSTAGHNLQAATTHPHSERELWKKTPRVTQMQPGHQHFREEQPQILASLL